MSAPIKREIVALSRAAHDLTESAYLAHAAVRGETDWPDKQRLLLADMALHPLQTALHDGPIDSARLQQNLYAILTISAPFIPQRALAQYAEAIIAPQL